MPAYQNGSFARNTYSKHDPASNKLSGAVGNVRPDELIYADDLGSVLRLTRDGIVCKAGQYLYQGDLVAQGTPPPPPPPPPDPLPVTDTVVESRVVLDSAGKLISSQVVVDGQVVSKYP